MYLSEIVKNHIDIKTRKLPYYIHDCFKKEIPLNKLNKLMLRQFATYMKSQVSANTARWYCVSLKAILHLYSDCEELKLKDYSVLHIRQESSVNIFLNEDELNSLKLLINQTNGKRRMYLLYFLISSYCGCRASDVVGIRREKIENGVITFVCKKTKRVSQVPVHKDLLAWVDTAKSLEKEYRFNDTIYKNEIKILCRMAGINTMVNTVRGGKDRITEKWEVCSPHTARRSFATNLYLRGADVYSICKMMGHSSVNITERYIVSGLKNMDEKVLAFFN